MREFQNTSTRYESVEAALENYKTIFIKTTDNVEKKYGLTRQALCHFMYDVEKKLEKCELGFLIHSFYNKSGTRTRVNKFPNGDILIELFGYN